MHVSGQPAPRAVSSPAPFLLSALELGAPSGPITPTNVYAQLLSCRRRGSESERCTRRNVVPRAGRWEVLSGAWGMEKPCPEHRSDPSAMLMGARALRRVLRRELNPATADQRREQRPPPRDRSHPRPSAPSLSPAAPRQTTQVSVESSSLQSNKITVQSLPPSLPCGSVKLPTGRHWAGPRAQRPHLKAGKCVKKW